MHSLELTAAITAIANAIAESASQDEIALISSALVQLGDTLATIASSRALRESRSGAAE